MYSVFIPPPPPDPVLMWSKHHCHHWCQRLHPCGLTQTLMFLQTQGAPLARAVQLFGRLAVLETHTL